MEMLVWNILIVISKCFFYIGFASAFGLHTFNSLAVRAGQDSQQYRRGIIISAIVASFAVVLWFFVNAGAMAEEGFFGMFDPLMLDILWTSTIGEATTLRVAAMLGLVFLQISLYRLGADERTNTTGIIINMLAGACFITVAYSFTVTGHVTQLSWVGQSLVVIHVLIMAWWLGSLLPLRKACFAMDDDSLQTLMKNFGMQASMLVPLLIAAGVGLAYLLVGSIGALIGSDYGQVLLLKLAAVVVIIGIAARNKLRLVPALTSANGKEALARSIRIEMGLALVILTLCAVLTSVVGPT